MATNETMAKEKAKAGEWGWRMAGGRQGAGEWQGTRERQWLENWQG